MSAANAEIEAMQALNEALEALIVGLKKTLHLCQQREQLLHKLIGLLVQAQRLDAKTFGELGYPALEQSTNERADKVQSVLNTATKVAS